MKGEEASGRRQFCEHQFEYLSGVLTTPIASLRGLFTPRRVAAGGVQSVQMHSLTGGLAH